MFIFTKILLLISMCLFLSVPLSPNHSSQQVSLPSPKPSLSLLLLPSVTWLHPLCPACSLLHLSCALSIALDGFPLIHLIHYLCSLQLDRFVCLPLLHTCILSYFTDDHSCYPVPTPYLYMIFQARQMSGSINKTSLASKTVDRYPRLFCEGVTLGN